MGTSLSCIRAHREPLSPRSGVGEVVEYKELGRGEVTRATGNYQPYPVGTNLGKALTPASSLNGGVSPWAAAFEQHATKGPPRKPASGAADQWAGLGQEQVRQRPPVIPQEPRVRRPASTPNLRSLDRLLPDEAEAALPAANGVDRSKEEDKCEGAAPSGQGLSSRRMRSVKDAARDGAMSLALRNFGARSALSEPDEAPHSAPTGSRLDPAMGECQERAVCSAPDLSTDAGVRRALRKIAALQALNPVRGAERAGENGGGGGRRMRRGSRDDGNGAARGGPREPKGGGGNATAAGDGFRPPTLRNGAYRPHMTAAHHTAWVAATGWAAGAPAPQGGERGAEAPASGRLSSEPSSRARSAQRPLTPPVLPTKQFVPRPPSSYATSDAPSALRAEQARERSGSRRGSTSSGELGSNELSAFVRRANSSSSGSAGGTARRSVGSAAGSQASVHVWKPGQRRSGTASERPASAASSARSHSIHVGGPADPWRHLSEAQRCHSLSLNTMGQSGLPLLVPVPFSDLSLLVLIGRGCFGRVYMAHYRPSEGAPKIQVAVKVITDCTKLRLLDGEPLEAVITRGMVHPNVVSVIANSWHSWRSQSCSLHLPDLPDVLLRQSRNSTGDIWSRRQSNALCSEAQSLSGAMSIDNCSEMWLIMEYCSCGTLLGAIKKGWFRKRPDDRGSAPDLAALLAAAQEIAHGMAFLHSRSVIHGDLTASNVLLAASPAWPNAFSAKVGDFGLSRSMVDQSRVETSTYGTTTHQPPEMLANGTISKACDVYAFGVLLWEMYNGCHAWEGLQSMQVIIAVVFEKQRLPPLADAPPALTGMVDLCTHPVPAMRPSFASLDAALAHLRVSYS